MPALDRRDLLKGAAALAAAMMPLPALARQPAVLILDGEEAIAGHLRRLLRSLYSNDVLIVASPSAAMRMIEREPFSLLMAEPSILGRDLIAWTSRIRRTDPQLFMLFNHGYAEDEFPAGVFQGERTELLLRPFTWRELARVCDRASLVRRTRPFTEDD